jgi:accessory gene regulator protein AgrB
MRTRNIIIIEVAILLGLFVSIFVVPRNLPISTFALIAASILVGANVFLFGKKRRSQPSEGGYKMTGRAYLALGLLIVFWILHFVWR